VVPQDDVAEKELRSNETTSRSHVSYLPIGSDALFERLWKIGLFTEINARCATLVDDFEEVFIEPGSIPALTAAVEAIAGRYGTVDSDVIGFLKELRQLAATAMRLQRPVVFVL
jgi:hypothetical protein